MAKTVKCYICKKEIKKEDAYIFTYTSKNGKEYRKYACSLEEIENDKRDKELYREIQYLTDEILGHTIVNNARNKKIKELQEAGYTNEQIFRCFKEYKDEIIKYLELSGIDKEYNRIAYIFTIIGNKIEDFSKEDERANQWEQYKQTEEEVDIILTEDETDEDVKNRLKNKKNKDDNPLNTFLKGLR